MRSKLYRVCQAMIFSSAIWLGCGDATTPIRGLGPLDEIGIVATGYGFTEGPASDSAGGLYFSDLNREKIYYISPAGVVSTFVEVSGRANGLMVDEPRNRLLACESGFGGKTGVSRIVAFDLDTRKLEAIATGYHSRPFNRVNDLVMDRQGGIYFSDILGGEPDLPHKKAAVYYVAPDGSVTRLIDDLARPNGVVLSPDEKILYVTPLDTPVLMGYPVISPGVIGKGRVVSPLPKVDGSLVQGGDGMAVDTLGNLYVALPSRKAVAVISSSGESLGLFLIPENPSNVVFGGSNRKALYVTARTSVYVLPMEVTGHVFGVANSQP